MNKKFKNLYNNFSSLSWIEKFFCAFPFFAILGSAFVNLFYVVIILFASIQLFKRNIGIKISLNIILFILIPYCIILISYFYSDYKNLSSFFRTLLSFKFFILPLIFLICVKNKFFFKILSFNTAIVIFFLSFDLIFQYYVGYDIFGIKQENANRISGFLGNEYVAGSFLSLFCVYFFLEVNLKFNNFKKYIYLMIFFIFFLIVIIITGERLALLRYLFFSFFIFIFTIENLKKKIFSFLVYFFIIINFLIFNQNFKVRTYEALFFAGISDKIVELEQYKPSSLAEKNVLSNSPWFSHWKTAYLIFKDNKLFGVGLKNFREACKESKYQTKNILNQTGGSCTTHPHNMYMEILSELGLIGVIYLFSVISFFIYIFIKDYLNYYKKKNFSLILTSVILFSIIPILPAGSIFSSYNGGIHFFIIGSYLVLRNKSKYEN
jgi:O-antigen ligase